MATPATGSIVLNVEAGKCKGSRWFLTGDLGFIVIKGDRLGLKKELKKLSSWSFPTEAGGFKVISPWEFWTESPQLGLWGNSFAITLYKS